MKLTRIIVALVISLLCLIPTVSAYSEKVISLEIDGTVIRTEVPPTVIGGRTMVPVRDIFEACGAKVNWDANTKTITGEKGNTTVVMQIDSNMLFINEKVTEMDATPVIIDGRTLAPARYVAESFGGIVDWDAENKVVMIDVADDDEEITETTTEATTVTEETTEATTVTETTTETTTTATTTEAVPSDLIVSTVRSDIQKAVGTYSLGSYETAGKFKATVVKQTTDNWTSMASTAIDKKYVNSSRVFFNRISVCYKAIDDIYGNKYYGKRLSDLRALMADYKKQANEIVDEYLKTRDINEINNLSNKMTQFVADMRTDMKVLYDNT